MQLHLEPDFERMSSLAMAAIIDAMERLLDTVQGRSINIVFSAGATVVRVYDLLVTHAKYRFDWKNIAVFQMDDYIGVVDNSIRFSRSLYNAIISPLEIADWHPLEASNGADMGDWTRIIQDHENKLADRGGIDLVVHGIGVNGHLGFNEPGSSRWSAGRVVRLAESTRARNPEANLKCGVTMGMRTLLGARESILLASGLLKASAVNAALEGPISDTCPASLLRLGPRTTLIFDHDAASQCISLTKARNTGP
jgi:glucosamine-6-phosphate deaminase